MATRYQITRWHEIDCGHRVYGHQGKCSRLHGHRYRFEMTCELPARNQVLDDLGMVADFSVIKDGLCAWLDQAWDHRLLLWERDPLAKLLLEHDHGVVLLACNPTAENLAGRMVQTIGPMMLKHTDVSLVACTVHETGKCSATAFL